MLTTFPSHLILLDLIALIKHSEEFKLWSSPSCNVLQMPVFLSFRSSLETERTEVDILLVPHNRHVTETLTASLGNASWDVNTYFVVRPHVWTPGIMRDRHATCAGGPGFRSRTEGRLSWLRFFVVFLSPFRKCLSTFNSATNTSLHMLSYSSFTNHPFIRRYIVWATSRIVK
jgi:hypothetical protein